MGTVHFFQYYCTCDNHLFDNGHIITTSKCLDRNYIFINRSLKVNVYIENSNIVKYGVCHIALGGVVYQWYLEKPDLIRFPCHLLLRRKNYLDIKRVLDEDGNNTTQFKIDILYCNRYIND